MQIKPNTSFSQHKAWPWSKRWRLITAAFFITPLILLLQCVDSANNLSVFVPRTGIDKYMQIFLLCFICHIDLPWLASTNLKSCIGPLSSNNLIILHLITLQQDGCFKLEWALLYDCLNKWFAFLCFVLLPETDSQYKYHLSAAVKTFWHTNKFQTK